MSTNTFGDWFTATARGLGYERDTDVARALNVSPSTVGRWRHGHGRPSVHELVKVSRLFRVRLEPLLVLAGLVERDEVAEADAPEPPRLISAAERRISDARIGDANMARLLRFWDARMHEEHQRLYGLIKQLEDGAATFADIPELMQTELSRHVIDGLLGMEVTR